MIRRLLIFTSVLPLISLSVRAQDCLYNETMCTCSFGSTDGSCYEKTGSDSTSDLCDKRTCDAGWTCDCEGDYYCDQADVDVYTLIDFNDYLKVENVRCQVVNQRVITSSGFKLGYFHPQFSDTGLLDQQCQTFAWWLDGVLQNSFSTTTSVTTDNLSEVKTSLSDWNSLPLRSGSVIGFRWAGAPYSCYNSISLLSINGTVTDTTNSAVVSHRFSNSFEDDWFGTDFVEGSNWNDPISSNTGDNYGSENTAITNVYWRIKIL